MIWPLLLALGLWLVPERRRPIGIRPRLAAPREIIGAAIFLAADASDIVTGHTIMCDDGYTIA